MQRELVVDSSANDRLYRNMEKNIKVWPEELETVRW